MLLKVKHKTTYRFGSQASYGLKQLRVMPKNRDSQKIHSWDVMLSGAKQQLSFEDQHHNHVILASIDEGVHEVVIESAGEIETKDTSGVIGAHGGHAPLWYFKRHTQLTKPGRNVAALAARLPDNDDTLARMHALSALIREIVEYQLGATSVDTTADRAIEIGGGVCQDHTHIMIACARRLGLPARYVSGYLMMNDRIEQEASHAWAEVYIEPLGWVGFDVSNGISPDERYVRVATGLDYVEAAPISGVRFIDTVGKIDGDDGESVLVDVAVQQ
ncbi:MAG: transglutaminase family protein [Pseudomonadota bacterium]